MLDRRAFAEELKKQLDAWNAELDSLEANVRQAKSEAKAQYEKQANELRQLLRQGEQEVERFRAAADEAWEEMRSNMEFTWKALRNSVNYFKSHFK